MSRLALCWTSLTLFTILAWAQAQEEAARPQPAKIPVEANFSGYAAVSAHWNFNNPKGRMSALRSYDARSDTFTLNAVHAAVTLDLGKGVTAVVEADAGSDASVNRLDPGGVEEINFDLQEAYVTYALPGLPFGFKAGKFATTAGIEVIESPDNPTITRGFLFGLAEPFTHVGFLVSWKEGPFEAAAGAVNGWDVVADNNTGKTALGKLTAACEDRCGITISLLVGPEQEDANDPIRRTVDVTGFVSPFSILRLNVQGLWGDDEVEVISRRRVRWYGFGLQPVLAPTEEFSAGFRVEWFRDGDGARTGVPGGAEVWNLTVAPALRVTDHLTVRIEGRLDRASEDLFEDEDGRPRERQATLSGEVIVRF